MSEQESPNERIEQGRRTVARMVEAAHELFAENGYAGTAMEDVVARAGVTRGALYHHFDGKRGLFAAVFEAAQQTIAQRIHESALDARDPWQAILAGSRAFLEAAGEPGLRRIVLIDGPAALGWAEWRRLDELYGVRELREGLEHLRREGLLKPVPVEAATRLLSGALNEAVLWTAEADDPAAAVEKSMAGFAALTDGLRAAP